MMKKPKKYKYRVWSIGDPDNIVIVTMPQRSSPMTVKDYACSNDLFKWIEYTNLRVRRI